MPRLLLLARSFRPTALSSALRPRNMVRALIARGWEVTVATVHPALVTNRDHAALDRPPEFGDHVRFVWTDHDCRVAVPDLFHPRYRPADPPPPAGGLPSASPPHAALCPPPSSPPRLARLRRALAAAGWEAARRLLFPDNGLFWHRPLMAACATLRRGDVDLVLATGNPYTAFYSARVLARRLGCAYLLDYRDPWSNNPTAIGPPRSWLVPPVEGWLLRGAALVTCTAPSHARDLVRRFGLRGRVVTITNGYDPEELAAASSARAADRDPRVPRPPDEPPPGEFSLVYAGGLEAGARRLLPVLRALARLREQRPDLALRLHYYGRQGALLRADLAQLATPPPVIDHGPRLRREVLDALRSAGLGIVIVTRPGGGGGAAAADTVPAKMFEHLGLGCPTLLVAPPGADAELPLVRARLGRRFAPDEIEAMAAYLADCAARGGAALRAGLCEEGRRACSWPELGLRLDRLLRAVRARTPREGTR